METANLLHEELDRSVASLAPRIATLKEKTSQTVSPEKDVVLGEIAELERQHEDVQFQLHELHRQGLTFRQDLRAALEKMAEDLAITIDHFMNWIDTGYRPDLRPNPARKP